MADHKHADDQHAKAAPKREERTWKETKTQARVRPQWNPLELANELLDQMEGKSTKR